MHRSSLIKFLIRCNSTINNSTCNIPTEIKIPNKIFRDDLTVLKALSSCVRNEKGLPDFFAIDDPFTLPKDFLMRKKLLLCKASGKLSAKMAFEEMKNEFIKVAHDEPKVKSLMPLIDAEEIDKAVKSGKSSIETGLKQLVYLLSPKDAWNFYESHKETKFSENVILSLLELLCVTGNNSYSLETPREDQYFSQKTPTEWRLDNPAELLFSTFENKDSRSYCAMIRGAAKHNNPSRSIELFHEMRTKFSDEFLDISTINCLLRCLHCSDLDDTTVQDFIIDILRLMDKYKVQPTAHTFNNAIFAVSLRSLFDFAESLYGEMLSINIEPTLGTYSVLLQCKFPPGMQVAMVSEVIDILEQRRSEIDYEETTSIDDRTLFTTAMALIRRLNKVDLALRLNEVVDSGGRFQMFFDEANRGRYFDCFFKLLLKKQHNIGDVLNLARRYVPNCYVLQPTTVNEFIEQIDASGQLNLLPVLLDLVSWNNKRHIETDSFPRILDLLLRADLATDAELVAKVHKCINKIFEQTRTRDFSVLTVDGNLDKALGITTMLGDGSLALLRSMLDFAKERWMLRVSMAATIIGDCFRRKEFDNVTETWRYLAEKVSGRVLRREEDRAALESLLAMAEAEVVPTMVRFSVDVTGLRDYVARCRRVLEQESSSSSSSDSDNEQ